MSEGKWPSFPRELTSFPLQFMASSPKTLLLVLPFAQPSYFGSFNTMECFLLKTFSYTRPMTPHCSFSSILTGSGPSGLCSVFLPSSTCQIPRIRLLLLLFFFLFTFSFNPTHNFKHRLQADDFQVYVPGPSGSQVSWVISLAAHLILSSMRLSNRSLKLLSNNLESCPNLGSCPKDNSFPLP